jgi:hypothetical protein
MRQAVRCSNTVPEQDLSMKALKAAPFSNHPRIFTVLDMNVLLAQKFALGNRSEERTSPARIVCKDKL